MRFGYVVLRFTSPFHVGRWSLLDSFDYIPSDVVYSALYSLSVATGLKMPERVSSAYPVDPVEQAVERRLGVPVPATWKIEAFKRGVSGKYVKRARFMPLACFKEGRVKVVNNEFLCELSSGGEIPLNGWPPGGIGTRVVVQRNRLSRHTLNADPYRVAAFMPRVPFVVYFQGGDARLFELLGALGVGGERTVGLGKFEVMERGEVELPDGGGKAMLMGVGRPVNFRNAVGEWAVRSWRCTNGVLGPLSVLLDGGVVEGDFEFEDVERTDAPCSKRLSPLWVWLS